MTADQVRLRRISRVRQLYRTGEATRIRINAGVSQSEFARGVGASPASVSLWEKGDRTPRGELALQCWLALESMRRSSAQSESSGTASPGTSSPEARHSPAAHVEGPGRLGYADPTGDTAVRNIRNIMRGAGQK